MTNPSVMLAQVVTLVGAVTVAVSDSFSTRTITLVSGGSTTYARVFLADGAASGTTASSPIDLLRTLEALLNAAPGSSLWLVRLDPTGAVRVTYQGTGTGTITWSGTSLRNLLGFTAGLSIAAGGSSLATYAPGGCVIAPCAAEDDSDWQPIATGVAAGETQTGAVVALDSTYRRLARKLQLRFLPKTPAEQTSGERLTPALPTDSVANSTRYTAPASAAYFEQGYSAHEFIATAHRTAGAPCAFALGDLQELIAGSATTFDVGYLSATTLRGGELFPLSVPGWFARRDCVLEINRTARVSR